tara:strand:+ start:14000 stop:14566 length:567 start_codon:yes stop_codon:yes gene_type:complete
MVQESVNQDDNKTSVGNNEKNKPSTQDENGNLIPQARFNEYVAKTNSKVEAMQKEIDKYKAKEQKHRQANLEAQGDYKQIIFEQDAELKNLREFKATIDKQNTEKRQSYLDMLTDDDREIYGDLPLNALEKHINKQKQALQEKAPIPATDTRKAVRNNNVPDEVNWADMDKEERRSNWDKILAKYSKK